jgi:cation:H+ antiporter
MLIALTLGALCPSIPNLAVALQAIGKGKDYESLAVSETIGSNIFTLLVTVGVTAVLMPVQFDPVTVAVTAPALLLVSGLFFVFVLRGTIGKLEGLLLVLAYLATVIVEYVARMAGGI